MPAFRACCAFLCLQLGATRIQDSEVALVQQFAQIRSVQLPTVEDDLPAQEPVAKAAQVPPQTAPLQITLSVKSNMSVDIDLVAQDEEDAMRLYNMVEERNGSAPAAAGGFPMYGCIFNVTPDPALERYHSPGVLFRYAPRMEATVGHAVARWGLRVAGWDTGLGFIKLPGWQHRYLPLTWDGKPVLRCTDDWSPGTYGGYGGGTMAYTDCTMATSGNGKRVPVKVLRRGIHDTTYDVRVMVPGMPQYDVPDVPVADLDPPPQPIADQYRAPEEEAGVNITLMVAEPVANASTKQITMLDTEPMQVFMDKLCTEAGYRRGWMCEKRSVYTVAEKLIEGTQVIRRATTVFASDTPRSLHMVDGETVTWYRWTHPPVPDPF